MHNKLKRYFIYLLLFISILVGAKLYYQNLVRHQIKTNRIFYYSYLSQVSQVVNWLVDAGKDEVISKKFLESKKQNPFQLSIYNENMEIDFQSQYQILDPNVLQNELTTNRNNDITTGDFAFNEGKHNLFVFFKREALDQKMFTFCVVVEFTEMRASYRWRTILGLVIILIIYGFLAFFWELKLKNEKMFIEKEAKSKQQYEMFETIIQSKSYLPLIITDQKGFIIRFGNASEKLFGYTNQEMIWSNIRTLFADNQTANNIIGSQIANRKVEMLSKSQKRITTNISIISLDSFKDYKKQYLYFIHDISEQQESHERLKQEMEKIEFLSKISEILANIDDYRLIIKLVIERLQEVLEFDYGTLYLKEGQVLKPFYSNAIENYNYIMNTNVAVGEKLTGLVAKTRKGMFINNAATNPLTINTIELEKKEACLVAVPLISKKNVLGVLTLTRTEVVPFNQEDFEFLELFSASTAGIIDNAILVSKLSNANEQLEDVLNKTHTGLFILENLKEITFVNETFAHFVEYPRDDLVHTMIEDLIVEDDFNLFKTLHMSLMFGTDSKEIRFMKKNGESIILELHLAMISQEGESRVIGTAIDVTEKQMLTEKLLNQRTKQNLELVSSSLIHDIKNILVGVSGPVSIIKEKYKNDRSLTDYTNLIQENLEYVILKTKEYLNPNSKLDESLVFDVNLVFNDSINQLSHVLGEQINVESKLSRRPILLKGPKEKFYTSLLNLFYNARDAMPDGGDIFFSTDIVEKMQLPQEVKNSEVEKWAVIRVRDTGSGIPDDVIDKIFVSHFSTKQEMSGTGLGLAMVKSTIETDFNGFIKVDSEVGKGTEFSFYIPHQLKRENEDEQFSIANQKLNIVHIDDEEYILDITQELLEVLGHTVTVFPETKTAEEFVLTNDNIDVIIVDRNLKNDRGEAFFERIYPKKPEIKFILASGYINSKEKKHLLNMGFSGVIEKPFDLKTINRVFQEILL